MKNLCLNCKSYLTQLKAQPWETIKLLCKSEARYCFHNFAGTSLYDKNKENLIKNSASGTNVPILEMMTEGLCQEHKNSECYYKKNSWGDEEHSFKEEPKPLNSDEMSLTQLEQYFIANNIMSMEVKGDKLIIKYNEEEKKVVNQIEAPSKK